MAQGAGREVQTMPVTVSVIKLTLLLPPNHIKTKATHLSLHTNHFRQAWEPALLFPENLIISVINLFIVF